MTDAGAVFEDLTAVAYGLSGLDWPSDEGRLRTLIKWLKVSCPQVLVNDAFVALRAGTEEPEGVVVAAGTGVTAAGRNKKGETARTLGLSYPFDDWGSARDLARAAVNGVARAYTGRGSATSLSGKLAELSATRNLPDLLESISREKYDLDAAAWDLTKILFEESGSGDAVAMEIIARAGRELGDGVTTVIRRLGMESGEVEVVLAGGVFRFSSSLLLKELMTTVTAQAPSARFIQLKAPVVVGSVLMAMDASNHSVTEKIRRSLEQGAKLRFFKEPN